jgi:hypothetical protein
MRMFDDREHGSIELTPMGSVDEGGIAGLAYPILGVGGG